MIIRLIGNKSIILLQMDSIDKNIIKLLQHDASLSAREIAEKVGLTVAPCWRRIQRLEAEGVITSRVAIIDPQKINLSVLALVEVRTNRHNAEWLEGFINAIKKFPEIIEANRTSERSELKRMVKEMMSSNKPYFLEVKVEKEDNVFPMIPTGESVSNIRLS